MKKQVLLVPVVMFFTTVAFSQTKRIALHSHSGPNSEFSSECEDNFGLGNIEYRKTSGDTVNMVQKSKSNETTAPKTDSTTTKTPAKAVKKRINSLQIRNKGN